MCENRHRAATCVWVGGRDIIVITSVCVCVFVGGGDSLWQVACDSGVSCCFSLSWLLGQSELDKNDYILKVFH